MVDPIQDLGGGIAEHLANADAALGLMDELALVLAFGLIGGLIAMRLRLPPIVGFLLAGIMMSPHTPGFVADTHTAEQLGEIGVAFLMFAVVMALFVSFGMNALFGVSVALGAFFAGLVVAASRLAHQVSEDVRPLRNLFGVLFFASVGMLLDPATLVQMPLQVITVVLIVVVAKSVIATAIALALRQSHEAALTFGAGLAQIGEFSFILGSLGRTLGLLPEEAYQLIITGAIVSIALNSAVFRAAALVARSWRTEAAPAGLAPLLAGDLTADGAHQSVAERR